MFPRENTFNVYFYFPPIAHTDQQNCKETGISLNTVENNICMWVIQSESLEIFDVNDVMFQVTPCSYPLSTCL